MKQFADAHEAFWFLSNHPTRGYLNTSFIDVLDVAVMKVNPESRRVEDDPAMNTEIEVWLESGPGYTEPSEVMGSVPWHDVDLDCGGPTFETALIRLAEKVQAKYGEAILAEVADH